MEEFRRLCRFIVNWTIVWPIIAIVAMVLLALVVGGIGGGILVYSMMDRANQSQNRSAQATSVSAPPSSPTITEVLPRESADLSAPQVVAVTDLKKIESNARCSLSAVHLDGTEYSPALAMTGNLFDGRPYVAYYLGKRYSKFCARIGVDDLAASGSSAEFVIYGDGKEIYHSAPMRAGSPPKTVSVDVSRVLRLGLLAMPGDLLNGGGACWAEARVYQK